MPRRSWLFAGLACVALWVAYLAAFNPLKPAAVRADYDWTLRDLDGRSVEFARYKGKAVFLNVWATWCPPCVGEMPSIAALAADPRLKDVAFVCASVDDSPEPVKRFIAGKNWPMTVLHAGPLPPAFQTDGIPATFILAPDGTVAQSEVGSSDWNDPKVVALLESLARAGKPAP